MATNSKKTGTAAKIGVMTLAIMNVAAVVSLRGLPAEAEYGLSSAFYYLFAAIVFLIPTSLVAAELAAMYFVGSVKLTEKDTASWLFSCNGSKVPSGIRPY